MVASLQSMLASEASTNLDALSTEIWHEAQELIQNKKNVKRITILPSKSISVYQCNQQTMPIFMGMITELSNKLNFKIPDICIYEKNDFITTFNAFAQFGNPHKICIGKDLFELLSYAELYAVLAHELHHLYYNHALKGLGVGLCMSIIESFFENNGSVDRFIHYSSCTPLMTEYVKAVISRYHEKQADLGAIKIIENPEDLCNALEKIEHAIIKEEAEKHPNNHKKSLIKKINRAVEKLYASHPSNKQRKRYLLKRKELHTKLFTHILQ